MIKNLLNTITILVALVRVVIEAVEIPGWGAEKKQAVLDVVSMFFDIVEENFFKLPFTKEKLLEIAGFLIDIFVSFFNATGEFQRSLNAMQSETTSKAK